VRSIADNVPTENFPVDAIMNVAATSQESTDVFLSKPFFLTHFVALDW
jgi:hypothetical protein